LNDTHKDNRGLPKTVQRILDSGVVVSIKAKIKIPDNELLGLKSTAVISSLKEAANIGLAFPKGINLEAPGWRLSKQRCPFCSVMVETETLKAEGCPWCGWNQVIER